MNYPLEFDLFNTKFVYDKVICWNGYYAQYNLFVNFVLIDEETVNEEFGLEDTTLIHCNVYHYNDLVSVGIGNDFYFAAIDAGLHHKLTAISKMYKELSFIKEEAFNS